MAHESTPLQNSIASDGGVVGRRGVVGRVANPVSVASDQGVVGGRRVVGGRGVVGRIAPKRFSAASDQIWDARALESRNTWRVHIPAAVADEFRLFCLWHPEAAADLDAFRFDARQLPKLAAYATEMREGLMHGDGIRWIRGLDVEVPIEQERRLFYLALGSAIGEVLTNYGRLYPVCDRGKDYKTEAVPVSMTSAPTGFHTDSSSVDVVPDVVGLLCEQPSQSGGDSLVSNALRVREILNRDAPEILGVLEHGFIRDVVTPGVEKNRDNLLRNRFPIFAPTRRREGVLFRYMRFWIERGQEKAGDPLTPEALHALDVLDELLRAEEQVVQFRLEKGDIVWINNRTLAHNRTGYDDRSEDRGDGGSGRRLQRMWIRVRAS